LSNCLSPAKHPNNFLCGALLKGEGRAYGKKIKISSGQWSTPGVMTQSKRFVVYFNGEKLYEVEGETFKDAGKVGLWTKADSAPYFDDLRIIAR
jgi:hypothetical protein